MMTENDVVDLLQKAKNNGVEKNETYPSHILKRKRLNRRNCGVLSDALSENTLPSML